MVPEGSLQIARCDGIVKTSVDRPRFFAQTAKVQSEAGIHGTVSSDVEDRYGPWIPVAR